MFVFTPICVVGWDMFYLYFLRIPVSNTSNVTSKTGIAHPSGAPGFINDVLRGYHMGQFIGKDTFGLKKVPSNHIWSISPPEYRELSHRTLNIH